MRIVKLTPESKNNILENLLKRSEGKTVYLWSYNYLHLAAEIKGATISEVRTAMGNLKQQSMIFLQMYAPEKMKRYLSIQRISIRQTSMQKMSV